MENMKNIEKLVGLAVVGVGAVFAVVVFVLEGLGGGADLGIDLFAAGGHFGYLFQDYGVVDGLVGVFAPGEGAVVLTEDAGHGFYVQVFKMIGNETAGVGLVVFQLGRGQTAQAGNFAVDVVGVGGSVSGDGAPGLGPAGGPGGVGVHDAADLRERPVELAMGGGVGGRV